MKYKITNLILKTDNEVDCSPSKVRGYFGNTFNQYPLLHNHFSEGKYIYNYPRVQYKIIENTIIIQGIDEGGDLLKEISSSLSTLSLNKEYSIVEKIIQEKEFDIKPSSQEKHYKFITPWLGLNANNYLRYIQMKSWKDKKELLNNILVGNFLSLSKGLGIIVNKRLYATSHLDEQIVEYKSVKMNAFTGEFKVHYDLPDYIGIGKGVSQGFGCVKQIYDGD